MAELTKPQYQSNRSQVYNVAPAQEQYRGPDPDAGQVDMSNAKIFESLLDGMDVFAEIYKESENTANQLQARDLIVQKTKHTQNLKEMLALYLPDTKYEDLKLADVLSKVRTMDSEGRSDLNIGATNEHNISIMQLPENISPQVKAMIEETFIRQDVDFMTSLMGHVEKVQSEQATLILSNYEADFKAGLFRDYHTTNTRSEGNALAVPRLKTLFAEIDALAKTNSWTGLEIEAKKQSAGQIMLQHEFDQSYFREGNSSRTSEQIRKDVIKYAKKGDFHYLNEKNEKVYLDPTYYKDRVFNHAEQERINNINTREHDKLERQKVNLSRAIRKRVHEGNFALEPFYRELIENDEYSEIEKDHIFNRLHAEEIRVLNEDATDDEKELNNRLLNKLSIITGELGSDSEFEKNISKYATKSTKTGKWEPKSRDELRELTDLPNFEQRHIRDYITVYNQGQVKNATLLKAAKNSSLTKEFVDVQMQRFKSVTGIASFFQDFAEGKENKNGETKWTVDDRKLGPNTAGGKLLSEFNLDEDPRFEKASRKEIIATKKHILQDLINRAAVESKKINDKFLKDQAGAIVSEIDELNRLDQITQSYAKSYEAMVDQGDRAFRDRVPSWKAKKPNVVQTMKFLAYRKLLDRVTDFGQKKDSYDLVELNTHITELRAGKINGEPVNEDFASSSSNYMLGVANDLETRKNALIKDGRNIGFIETGQEAILKSTGKYDMDAWYKWAVNKRLDFTNIEIISSAEAEMLQNLDKGTKEEALVQYSQLYSILNRYGDKKSHGYNVAYKNMYKNLDNKYKNSFSLLVRDGSFNPSKIKRIWDYGKLDILKTKSNKLGED